MKRDSISCPTPLHHDLNDDQRSTQPVAAAGLSHHGTSGGSPYPQTERRPARRGQGA